jgi:hypothetical protein
MNLVQVLVCKKEIEKYYRLSMLKKSGCNYELKANYSTCGMTPVKFTKIVTDNYKISFMGGPGIFIFSNKEDCSRAFNLLCSYLFYRDYT